RASAPLHPSARRAPPRAPAAERAAPARRPRLLRPAPWRPSPPSPRRSSRRHRRPATRRRPRPPRPDPHTRARGAAPRDTTATEIRASPMLPARRPAHPIRYRRGMPNQSLAGGRAQVAVSMTWALLTLACGAPASVPPDAADVADSSTPRDASAPLDAASPLDASTPDAGTPVTCEGETCSGHGICRDDAAGAACACDFGFEGARCQTRGRDAYDRALLATDLADPDVLEIHDDLYFM